MGPASFYLKVDGNESHYLGCVVFEYIPIGCVEKCRFIRQQCWLLATRFTVQTWWFDRMVRVCWFMANTSLGVGIYFSDWLDPQEDLAALLVVFYVSFGSGSFVPLTLCHS